MNSQLRRIQMWQRILQFFGKPPTPGVLVVAAAGLCLAVVVQKRPVGWTPVAESDVVLFNDGLPKLLSGRRLQRINRIEPLDRGHSFGKT
jgi:hypothetical protein